MLIGVVMNKLKKIRRSKRQLNFPPYFELHKLHNPILPPVSISQIIK